MLPAGSVVRMENILTLNINNYTFYENLRVKSSKIFTEEHSASAQKLHVLNEKNLEIRFLKVLSET